MIELEAGDRDRIESLFAVYANANDEKDPGAVLSTFAAEFSYSIAVLGKLVAGPFSNERELRPFLDQAFGDQSDQRRHVTTNFRFEGKGPADAIVAAYLTLFATTDAGAGLRCTGIYETELTRSGTGWAFTRMHIALDGGY